MVAGSNGSAEPKFSHITLGALEDDEVILAGAVEGGEDAPAEQDVAVAEYQSAAAQAAEVQPAAQAQPEPAAAPAPASPQAAPAPEPVEPAAPAKPAKPATKAYRETTLEDLERQPMPLAQKVTLIAAVVLIVCFVAYRLFMM